MEHPCKTAVTQRRRLTTSVSDRLSLIPSMHFPKATRLGRRLPASSTDLSTRRTVLLIPRSCSTWLGRQHLRMNRGSSSLLKSSLLKLSRRGGCEDSSLVREVRCPVGPEIER